MKIEKLEQTGSTNTEALARVQAGERGPLWVVARVQTDGRGRSGRAWAPGSGNLYATYLTAVSCPDQVVGQLSLVAGVAFFSAVEKANGHQPVPGLRLKWPNDVFHQQSKLGGILVETTSISANGGLRAVALGFGLNVATAPDIADRETTSLSRLGFDVSVDDMVPHLDEAVRDALALWDSGSGFPSLRYQWLMSAGGMGQPMSVHVGDGLKVVGTFAGLDPTGALLLDCEDGTRKTFTYGDVEFEV